MLKTTILLADDHPLIRNGIKTLLQSQPDISIVAEADDGDRAVELVERLRPRMVIMDISMPKRTGLEAAAIIRNRFPETKVLILSMHDSDAYAYQVVQSGAHGYILKSADKSELLRAVREIMRGNTFYSKSVSRKIAESRQRGSADPLPITRRERQVLKLITEGLNNTEIAERLFISPRTVDTHRTNMMQKLKIKKTAALVRYAMEKGLI